MQVSGILIPIIDPNVLTKTAIGRELPNECCRKVHMSYIGACLECKNCLYSRHNLRLFEIVANKHWREPLVDLSVAITISGDLFDSIRDDLTEDDLFKLLKPSMGMIHWAVKQKCLELQLL